MAEKKNDDAKYTWGDGTIRSVDPEEIKTKYGNFEQTMERIRRQENGNRGTSSR